MAVVCSPLQAKVLYDFISEGEGELSVYTNELITITKKVPHSLLHVHFPNYTLCWIKHEMKAQNPLFDMQTLNFWLENFSEMYFCPSHLSSF